MMSRLLIEARKKFRGQKASIEKGFDNTPIPEGKYTARVAQAEVRDAKDKDQVVRPQLYLRLSIELGPLKKRGLFPFNPYVDEPDGIASAADNLRRILGDAAVPGRQLPTGIFEVDCDKFLAVIESLAHQCIGELLEVTVKNSLKSKRPDGTPRQNTYINRALGEDKAGVPTPDEHDGEQQRNIDPDDNLDMTPAPKRRVAKR
jgi:hypothetical protein